MEKTISVIIPVYNVAPYLEECLHSVLSQSYRALEILVIDDGSTDGSGAICDRFAETDSRIRVIHQKNGGAAAAKNAGLRAATGEYLSFVDSDDFLEPGAYSHMRSLLEGAGADVVQCAYRDVFRSRTADRIHKSGRVVLPTAEYLPLYTTDWTCALLWDKLYRRDLFAGIFFEEGHKIDDEYFTYQGILNANKVVFDDRIVYNYRKRRSGVMLSPDSARRILLDRIDYLGKRRVRIAARFPALRRTFDLHFLESMLYLRADPHFSTEAHAALRGALRAYFREKDHTPPPLGWLGKLMKLYFGKAPQPKPVPPAAGVQDDFFD